MFQRGDYGTAQVFGNRLRVTLFKASTHAHAHAYPHTHAHRYTKNDAH